MIDEDLFLSDAARRILSTRTKPKTFVNPEKPIPQIEIPQRKIRRQEPSRIIPLGYDDYIPSLEDILEFASNHGSSPVIDEDKLMLSQLFCIIGGLHYMVKGDSGSGKTHTTDKMISLLNQDSVYKVGLSSETAIFRDKDLVNQAAILYIPELQKAMQKKNSAIVELVKDLTEGKDCVRSRTLPNGNVTKDIIYADKTIITTLAKENTFKEDAELKRRMVVLETNQSVNHVRKVIQYGINKRSPQAATRSYNSNIKNLLEHHIDISKNLSYQIVDPFFQTQSELIPQINKAIGYKDHYLKMVDACTLFHYKERLMDNGSIYTSLSDHTTVFNIYHDLFCKTLREFSKDEEISSKEPDWDRWFQKSLVIMKESVNDDAYQIWLSSNNVVN